MDRYFHRQPTELDILLSTYSEELDKKYTGELAEIVDATLYTPEAIYNSLCEEETEEITIELPISVIDTITKFANQTHSSFDESCCCLLQESDSFQSMRMQQ